MEGSVLSSAFMYALGTYAFRQELSHCMYMQCFNITFTLSCEHVLN